MEENVADLPRVAILFQVHARKRAVNHAIVGQRTAGPDDPSHSLLSPGSRHPTPLFGATVIRSRFHQSCSVLNGMADFKCCSSLLSSVFTFLF